MFPIQDVVPSRRVPLITWFLIALNGFVFLEELALSPEQLERFVAAAGLIPARMAHDPRSWWTLLTCMFLHGGWLHFIGNMWTLYLFGDNVEDRMGPALFLLFYLLCGAAAGIAHLLTAPNSVTPTIGASGAIAGVLGAYFLLFPTARIITLVPLLFVPFIVEVPAVVYLGVWLLTQVYSGALALIGPGYYEGVAWWAHVGGFVAGIVLLPLFAAPGRPHRRAFPDEYQPW